MKGKSPSDVIFERYSLYYRCITKMFTIENREITDSNELSRKLKIDSSLIRRDLSLLGKLGKRGMGYSLSLLKEGIENFLGKYKDWNVALVGIGNLGKAILLYFINQESNYHLKHIYDADPAKFGTRLSNFDIEDFATFNKDKEINLAVITVPADQAQAVTNRLVDNGIQAILNFAPIKLNLPDNIFYREVDIIKELDILSGMMTFEGLEKD